MFFRGSKQGTLLFKEAHRVWGGGIRMSRQFGRPDAEPHHRFISMSLPYLGYCARAFSVVKQQVKFQEPDLLSYDTPL